MMQSLPPDPTQAELVEITKFARAGDQQAFTQLFERYHGPICTYLAHLVSDDEVGRDLAQETFLRAWKDLPKLQGDIAFRPWLYRIATDVAQSYLQRGRRMRWLPRGDAERDTPQSVLSVAGPEEQTGEQECMKQVLTTLAPQYRACLLLQHVAGFAQREIAAILGISEKNISAYVSRGREQFRLAYQQLKGASLPQTKLTPCPMWAEKLAATHPEDLTPFERMVIQKHIASCATCATIRAEYEEMGQYLSQLPVVEPRPGLPPRLRDLWQAQGSHLASAPSILDDQPAEGTSALQSTSVPPSRPIRRGACVRILMIALVMVLGVGALLGSSLFLLSHRTGPARPGLHPSRGWQLVSSPSPGLTQNGLNGVAVVSANDIWAVGNSSNSPPNGSGFTSPNMLIEHWNGIKWSVVKTPNSGLSGYNLSAVAAVSASDVWAVGYSPDGTLIEHWNGTQWSVVKSPNPGSSNNFLYGLVAVSASDVWAVGYSSNDVITNGFGGQMPLERTLIEHWNGKQWNVVPSPNPGVIQNFLNGVAAISAHDIWAVGGLTTFTPPYTFSNRTLIEHWNGSKWSIVESANNSIASGNSLNGVAVVSASDVWAVGGSFSRSVEQTLIEHWNGTQWSIVRSADNPIAYSNGLSGVTVISANNIWAVGHSPRVYPLVGPTLIEHWNGTQWSLISSPYPGKYNNFLTAVVQVPHSSEIWAVGYYGEGYTPERTITEVYSP